MKLKEENAFGGGAAVAVAALTHNAPQAASRPAIGFALPQAGRPALRDRLVVAAQRAEALGYDTVWAFDRGHGGETVIDPFEALAFVAGRTGRIGLGAAVLEPARMERGVLAGRFATLGVFAGERRKAGIGMGWPTDEAETVASPIYLIGEAGTGYESGQSRPSVGAAVATFGARVEHAREAARLWYSSAAGPRFVVRANCAITFKEIDGDRLPFSGTYAQIAADAQAFQAAGADEVLFDVSRSPGVETLRDLLLSMERIRKAVEPEFDRSRRPADEVATEDYFDYYS